MVFGLTAAASFSSGLIMAQHGWESVNVAALPFIGAAVAAVGWLARNPSHIGRIGGGVFTRQRGSPR